jgi:hypothetical protein
MIVLTENTTTEFSTCWDFIVFIKPSKRRDEEAPNFYHSSVASGLYQLA